MNDLDLLKSRFHDLSERAYAKGIWTFSDFLTLDEQSELMKLKLSCGTALFGGFDEAERKIAIFGSERDIGYPFTPPIVCVKTEPIDKRFSEKLTHRDFLGSIMGLGIKREKLGDIIVSENSAYIFAFEDMGEYIASELSAVRKTPVKCGILSDIPNFAKPSIEKNDYIVSSDRLDGIIAAVYNISRGESQRLFSEKRVFVNSKLTENTSLNPTEGQIISVRGKGRFIYYGILRTTKKGRIVISAGKFI
ncbi:MAG: YlmH/Sll1252 family protein [Clostridiales bacterium]|nr:YlmH/Sll1252 family protein [Clostridiales bacterium]